MSREGRVNATRFLASMGLVTALSALVLGLSASPSIAANNASQRVALIPGPAPVPAQGLNGIMPTASYVTGYPSEKFSNFAFSNVGLDEITPANLAKHDTVALIQVHTSSLSSAAKTALVQFVANGGKLLIHDADETNGNDYSWLLGGTFNTKVGLGCDGVEQPGKAACGSQSGTSTIVTNSGIISSNPADSSYVDLADLRKVTDQGDANLLVSTDPRWNALAQGTNSNGESGAAVAYAHVGDGLIIYNGFDTDFIKTSATDHPRCAGLGNAAPYYCPANAQPKFDWLAHMWYSELTQAWGSGVGIPPATPVVGIGTPVSAGAAGLPSQPTLSPSGHGHACVAPKSLRLRLNRFAHIRHRRIVQVDVYVNGKHRFRERRHFRNAMVHRLPSRGRYTVTVIATTKRGYHLIAKRHYSGC